MKKKKLKVLKTIAKALRANGKALHNNTFAAWKLVDTLNKDK